MTNRILPSLFDKIHGHFEFTINLHQAFPSHDLPLDDKRQIFNQMGQSWSIIAHISPFETTYIYIYVEYIPIYNHCLSINWYRIIFCFFEHKILSILTTYHGSKLVKPWFFPAGNLRCEANELGEMHRAMSAPRGAKACHGCAGKV